MSTYFAYGNLGKASDVTNVNLWMFTTTKNKNCIGTFLLKPLELKMTLPGSLTRSRWPIGLKHGTPCLSPSNFEFHSGRSYYKKVFNSLTENWMIYSKILLTRKTRQSGPVEHLVGKLWVRLKISQSSSSVTLLYVVFCHKYCDTNLYSYLILFIYCVVMQYYVLQIMVA